MVGPDVSLHHLKTLLDFNRSVTSVEQPEGLDSKENEYLAEAFDSLRAHAAEQGAELEEIIEEWKRARRPEPTIIRLSQSILSNRELLESWIEVKTTAVDMFRSAARDAPDLRLRERLERLARNEERLIAELREFL